MLLSSNDRIDVWNWCHSDEAGDLPTFEATDFGNHRQDGGRSFVGHAWDGDHEILVGAPNRRAANHAADVIADGLQVLQDLDMPGQALRTWTLSQRFSRWRSATAISVIWRRRAPPARRADELLRRGPSAARASQLLQSGRSPLRRLDPSWPALLARLRWVTDLVPDLPPQAAGWRRHRRRHDRLVTAGRLLAISGARPAPAAVRPDLPTPRRHA